MISDQYRYSSFVAPSLPRARICRKVWTWSAEVKSIDLEPLTTRFICSSCCSYSTLTLSPKTGSVAKLTFAWTRRKSSLK